MNAINGNHADTPTSGSVLSPISFDLAVSDLDHLLTAQCYSAIGNKCGLARARTSVGCNSQQQRIQQSCFVVAIYL
jgi:hypothetical protein